MSIRNYIHDIKRIRRMNSRRYGNRENLSIECAENKIVELIKSNRPFSVIRMGFGELDFMNECYLREKKNLHNKPYKRVSMSSLLGEKENGVEDYNSMIREAFFNADIITCWYQPPYEKKMIKEYSGENTVCTTQHILEPIYSQIKWIHALEGKRVLVVSPFSKTIEKQVPKLDKVYPSRLWPNVEIKTVTSVWYDNMVAKDSRFANWFEALEYMKSEINKIDYDIALLGCGTFGTPLVDYIKQTGKQAIYMGGVIQMLFGIRGNRWDNDGNKYSGLYNDYWTRLGDDNKPEKAEGLEGACYW